MIPSPNFTSCIYIMYKYYYDNIFFNKQNNSLIYSNSSFMAIPLCEAQLPQMRAYLFCGPSPTRYSSSRSMVLRSRGMMGRGRGGAPRMAGPGVPGVKNNNTIDSVDHMCRPLMLCQNNKRGNSVTLIQRISIIVCMLL